MIGKLHSLFLWSALAISVCVGFSVAVFVNKAHASTTNEIQCERGDISGFITSWTERDLKHYMPRVFTFPPPYFEGYIDEGGGKVEFTTFTEGVLTTMQKYNSVSWTFFENGRLIGRAGPYIARYKCSGGITAYHKNLAYKNSNQDKNLGQNTASLTGAKPKAPKYANAPDHVICLAIQKNWSSRNGYIVEAKNRGLTCGVGAAVTGEVASVTSTVTSSPATGLSVSSAAPQTPSASASKPSPVGDGNPPTISIASNTANGPQAKIEGRVFDEDGIAEVIIDGKVVGLGSDGSFTALFYVPRSGKTLEIVAFDSKGNKATKSLVLERGQMRNATGPSFASLNPSGKRVKPNQDALALIIGVADYERTPARAAYADKDAQTFYDYAMLKLGIPATNIKELVNADANEAEVRLAVKDWIARSTKQGQSDVYVFFAGHGLANQSGDDMYLLPVDGEPRLLSDTAIARERLFADIAAANPRSVTVFLDTCYSGTTRGTDMLIASRPIAIRAKEQAVPEGFTVMTAAAGDQTAKPLEEAKHGMFSYFLMKGMEGDADTNSDNQITAGELHAYVQQNVIQQSSGSQTPELQGDANRVLVRFQ